MLVMSYLAGKCDGDSSSGHPSTVWSCLFFKNVEEYRDVRQRTRTWLGSWQEIAAITALGSLSCPERPLLDRHCYLSQNEGKYSNLKKIIWNRIQPLLWIMLRITQSTGKPIGKLEHLEYCLGAISFFGFVGAVTVLANLSITCYTS